MVVVALLHANMKWPDVMDTVLWTYANSVVDKHNKLSLYEHGRSPLERLSGIRDEIVPTYVHTWGCPVRILDAANQTSSIGTPKCN